jgi:hypothetical protein
MTKKMLPIGVDNFEKIRTLDLYYVDKTNLIRDLLTKWGEVNLITRPRRFGKSLNMSMLKNFFQIGCDKTLFDGLNISKEQELCEQHMGQYPVISISLKSVDGLNFQAASTAMKSVIGNEALRFQFLKDSPALSANEKALYTALTEVKNGLFVMDDDALTSSLKTLSELLCKHYGRNVVLLIDEYDVPLDKAFDAGYYNGMVSLIRNMFGNALKTNDSLWMAVLTGCLRISKESIFTGLNNLNVLSITDEVLDEYFGFTDEEVQELLEYYQLAGSFNTMKEWYDGYRFGNANVYCPWDVIKYTYKLLNNPNAFPENYWSNTSSNSIVRRLINRAGRQTKDEIECLIAGETITKDIRQDLTYSEIDSSIGNLWSVLFSTGYLTKRGQTSAKTFQLAIPNREIRELFIDQVTEWFEQDSGKDAPKLDAFCEAFPAGDPETIEQLLADYLWDTISIRDTAVKSKKENFYHGILLGLLRHKEQWLVKSNAESGDGYSDILVQVQERERRVGIVIEVKYAEDIDALDAACEKALNQIEDLKYEAALKKVGIKSIKKYGIACFGKYCKVMMV